MSVSTTATRYGVPGIPRKQMFHVKQLEGL